jgi:hypothetical protein
VEVFSVVLRQEMHGNQVMNPAHSLFSSQENICTILYFCTRERNLRHYAASRKVAGLSPDEVDFLN